MGSRRGLEVDMTRESCHCRFENYQRGINAVSRKHEYEAVQLAREPETKLQDEKKGDKGNYICLSSARSNLH
ncbi:hypothetical protein C8Q74DRAFT_318400 [Fomes fomentarius]|nr:hypothetical protein C8Q74DRAFT_318400 [Fomes fomentarius]